MLWTDIVGKINEISEVIEHFLDQFSINIIQLYRHIH